MSKEAAMAIATGNPVAQVNPSLVVGDMKGDAPASTESVPTQEVVQKVMASDGHAIIAKKEAKLLKERQALKLEQERSQNEIKEAREVLKRIKDFEEKKKSNPIEALKETGFTETDILNWLAEQDQKTPTPEDIARSAASDEIKKFKEEQQKVIQEAEKAQRDTLVKKFYTDVDKTFKSDPDQYEFSIYNKDQAIKEARVQTQLYLKEMGEAPTPDMIATIVEAAYEGEWENMKNLKKIKGRAEQQTVSSDVPKDGARPEPQRTRTVSPPIGAQPSKTLTNKATATVASTVVRRETHDQKKERLITSLLNGTYVPQK